MLKVGDVFETSEKALGKSVSRGFVCAHCGRNIMGAYVLLLDAESKILRKGDCKFEDIKERAYIGTACGRKFFEEECF
jgi:hypothetical protein